MGVFDGGEVGNLFFFRVCAAARARSSSLVLSLALAVVIFCFLVRIAPHFFVPFSFDPILHSTGDHSTSKSISHEVHPSSLGAAL